ncbi:MAG: hypothetical protein EBU96_01130 [Actinobacteria bacterium]|nr:hypothetical protein [Actinomycetota bacterium]
MTGARAIGGVNLSRTAPIIGVTFAASSSTISCSAVHNLVIDNYVRFAGSSDLPAAITAWAWYQVNSVPTNQSFTIKNVGTTTVITPATAGSSYVIGPDPNVSYYPQNNSPGWLITNESGVPASPPGGGNPIGIRCVTPLATASMADGDHFTVYQKIPIERCANLRWHSNESPKKASFSFYAYTNKPGLYTGCIVGPSHFVSSSGSPLIGPSGALTTNASGSINSVPSSSVVSRIAFTFTFTVNSANTWQKISVTADAFPTLAMTSTTVITTLKPMFQPGGLGLTVGITLAAKGSASSLDLTNTSTASNMLHMGTTAISAAGRVSNLYVNCGHSLAGLPALPPVGNALDGQPTNLFDTSGNYFYFTQAQLEAADSPTDYEIPDTASQSLEWRREYQIATLRSTVKPYSASQVFPFSGVFPVLFRPYRYLNSTLTTVDNSNQMTSLTGSNIDGGSLDSLDLLKTGSISGYFTASSATSTNSAIGVFSLLVRYHPHDFVTQLFNLLVPTTILYPPRLT